MSWMPTSITCAPCCACCRPQEPVGIGARNLRECLLIQIDHLEERGLSQPHAREIVSQFLTELGEHKFARIAHELKISPDVVSDGVGVRQAQAEPAPGPRLFADQLQRPRHARDVHHPGRHDHPGRGRRVRDRSRRESPLRAAHQPDVHAPGGGPAPQQRQHEPGREEARPAVRRAGQAVHRQHQPAPADDVQDHQLHRRAAARLPGARRARRCGRSAARPSPSSWASTRARSAAPPPASTRCCPTAR